LQINPISLSVFGFPSITSTSNALTDEEKLKPKKRSIITVAIMGFFIFTPILNVIICILILLYYVSS